MEATPSKPRVGATIIALAGKGGVGKTSLSAAVLRTLAEEFPGRRVLAIDADPAVGLATALGLSPSTTIDDIRREVIATATGGEAEAAIALLGEARYRLLDAMVEEGAISFLAIGRPEAEGCYCSVNSYLREAIRALSSSFDFVVIDGEAGIEQVNRRVMERVTHLILVTDASAKGAKVLRSIHEVAGELVMYERVGAVANRLPARSALAHLDTGAVPILASIMDDRDLADADLAGRSVHSLDGGSEILRGAREALRNLGILKGEGDRR